MRQNESNLIMTTDVAVTTNTTNMEEKGMKGFFKNMKKKVLPAVAGSVTGAMLMTSTCFAAGTGTTAVTQPLENLKTLVIAVIGAVGVIILAKNVMEFAQAYQQQDSSTMNSALKGIVAGVMMAGISTVLTFLDFVIGLTGDVVARSPLRRNNGHLKYFQMELLSIMLIQEQEERSLIRIKFKSMPRVLLHFMMQMEKTRKQLLVRLDRLSGEEKKDNVVTFEQLGVDRLFVDESQNYKNLFLYTKMRNVAGIAQTEAQKSSDMFAKCQYMDEITGGKGITFATGTPISNSMTELYTNMRYLQYDMLQSLGLGNFDAWASTFGETQTAIELAPEGTGYRAKTRFAKFYNLPELISLFKECADIQTADMLKLPVPEAEYENVVLKPSDFQKEMVRSLADRAEAVRNSLVEPYEDNMLKITNDGRKLALDQRLINSSLPDNENSKAAACVERAFQIWRDTAENKSTQLIFSDLATPKGDGSFNVYGDIRQKLVSKGVPEEEIKFIHEANTEVKKAELFAKVRSGQVRFLLGSTAKMGAGTNVQDRLIALHHLDVPWRPSDVGRILRTFKIKKNVEVTDNGKIII